MSVYRPLCSQYDPLVLCLRRASCTSNGKHPKKIRLAHLCDLLDVADTLQSLLELPERGHLHARGREGPWGGDGGSGHTAQCGLRSTSERCHRDRNVDDQGRVVVSMGEVYRLD